MFWLIFLLGALAALGPFSIDTYLPAFPAIAQSFHTTVGDVEATLAIYFVGLSLGQLFYGPFADSYGRKPPLYFGLVLFIASAIGCVYSTSIAMLTVLRFFQAVGGCASMLIARTVVRDYFPPREAARIFSFLMLVIGVSPVVAPIVGGFLVVHVSWRATFWVVIALGVACLLSVALFLKETLPPERRHPIHFSGVLSLYGGLLRDRAFLVHALSGSLAMAGLFAYLEGSPLVFIELNHISAGRFGLQKPAGVISSLAEPFAFEAEPTIRFFPRLRAPRRNRSDRPRARSRGRRGYPLPPRERAMPPCSLRP
jgi:DHA1 family bicyclomycin/chloramphenicol resistance-like MFS transporter